jgi:hypothetical protein
MMLQACLGIRVDGANGVIEIDRPELPPEVERLTLRNLVVGDDNIDIAFERTAGRVAATPVGKLPRSTEILVRA